MNGVEALAAALNGGDRDGLDDKDEWYMTPRVLAEETLAALAASGWSLVRADGLERRTAELQFIRLRAEYAGTTPFTADRFVGRSSNAMVRAALDGAEVDPNDYPRDGSDLRSCELTLAMAPPHLQAHMEATLGRYRVALAARRHEPQP